MKPSTNKIIAAIVVVGILGSIGKLIENKTEPTKVNLKDSCNVEFDDFAIRGEKGSLRNLYVKVSNYNKGDTSCKKAIYEHFKKQKEIYKTTICVNYLDSIDFDPPRDGRTFGNNNIHNFVIAQIINLKTNKEEVYYDPFVTGKY